MSSLGEERAYDGTILLGLGSYGEDSGLLVSTMALLCTGCLSRSCTVGT